MRASSLKEVYAQTQGVRIVDGPTGADNDMPYVRWVLANQSEFRARMPLTEFLRVMPNWLLKEVSANNDAWLDAAVFLVQYFEGLWSTPIGHLGWLTTTECYKWCVSLSAGCLMERERRLGMSRWTVNGDDRLRDAEQTMTFEINPALIGPMREPLPSNDVSAIAALRERCARIALTTDWPDFEALKGE